MITTLLDLSVVRFLIVDDSAKMRFLLTNMLNSLGAELIHEISDGADAIEFLRYNHVDIVLTDWMMTPVDGIEFTRHVRTAPDSQFQMVPIIMISGHTEARHVAQARNAGVTEFLAKPVSALALYKRIEEVILRPRQFVRAKTYTGPDRHRHSDDTYNGPRRRDNDKDRKSKNDSGGSNATATSKRNTSEA